jgi:hypothetical protein
MKAVRVALIVGPFMFAAFEFSKYLHVLGLAG